MTTRAAWPVAAIRPSEAQCEDTIVAAAILHGWHVHAERAAQRQSGKWATPIKGHAGWPDLVLVHPYHRVMIVAELKRKPNRVEPAQKAWHAALATVGIDVQVWWVPEQMPTILALLANAGDVTP